jgi:hypothetical protein
MGPMSELVATMTRFANSLGTFTGLVSKLLTDMTLIALLSFNNSINFPLLWIKL